MVPSSDRLSICFVTQYFPPETGAAPTRVDELTARWAGAGHDVTVLTSAPDYPEGELYEGFSNEWVTETTRGDVTVHYTKTVPAASGNLGRRALKFVWFAIVATLVGLRGPRYDVVIATSPQPLTGLPGWLLARRSGSTFVFEVRDLWPESITSLTGAKTWLLAPLGVLVRFLYRRADVLVTVSRGFEEALVDAGVDPSSIAFHPNGADVEFYRREDDDIQIDGDLERELADEFVVSYVGTIGRAHGLSVVLEAAERLADLDVTFLLVGDGAEADRLREEATERGLDSVRFVGRRPKREVPDFLALSDVSLVHLRDVDLFETVLPSKLFEAMGAGVPVALGVRGEAERVLTEANAGLTFEPEDPDALAAVVRRLHDDPELRREFGENGRAFVDESYSWDAIAGAYLETLQRP